MNGDWPAPAAPGRAGLVAVLLVVVGVIGGHVTSLPTTLEDIDSVNFALGVRDFDPGQHRPHPPGYPVYIALGKASTAVTRMAWPDGRPDRVEARALAALSLAGALALVWLIARLSATLARGGAGRTGQPSLTRRAALTALLFAACPLTWYLAARPMSDVPGLAAAAAALACLGLAWWRQHPAGDGSRRLAAPEMVASGRMIVLGALLAGLAVGFRTQTLWMTAPLLVLVLADRAGRGLAGALLGSAVAFTAGALAWGIPLVVASGGLNAYLAALGSQAGEDFAGVEMLYLNPTPRLAAFALMRTFVWPWDSVPLAGVVLVVAAIGAIVLAVRERRALLAVGAITVPYLAFHLAFQDTVFSRYALPLMVPVAFLAAAAFDAAGRGGVVAGVAVAAWSLSIAVPGQRAYAERGSPTARLFDRLAAEVEAGARPLLAMHQALQRPLEAETRDVGPRLPSPPRREWLELARHWRTGATGPLWFLADPRRTDLALIDPQARRAREDFTWDIPSLSRLGGMRPEDVSLYRLAAPGWFAAEGWSLTPETAGMARLMGRGPHLEPVNAFIRRRPEAALVVIGGRNLGAADDPPVTFTLALDGRDLESWVVAPNPGFFVRRVSLPAAALAGAGEWATLSVRSAPATLGAVVPTSIEQFDVQSPGVLMWAYGEGFHEPELDNAQGRAWRWMGEQAVLEVPQTAGDLTLEVRGESPLAYFPGPSTLEVRAANSLLGRVELRGDFTVRIGLLAATIEAAGGRMVLTTTQTFSPAERDGSGDRRRLGLRLFAVDLVSGLPAGASGQIPAQNTSDLR
ncbi:MAG: DUF2723 domain-containing protein [Acidobacteria bacterium]|nr:DUF2723 domain-containing protein [Acidobacteriota bacterium]